MSFWADGALVALGSLPRFVTAAAGLGAPAAAESAARTFLAETAEELLTEYPESASALGIDKEGRAGLKSRLTDRSPEGVSRAAAVAGDRRKKLAALSRDGLSAATRLDLAVVDTAYGLAAEGYAFAYGDMAILDHQISYRNAPYVVTQNTGAFVEVPDFLDSHHTIAAPADAESYLERLQAYARALDGETRAAPPRQRRRCNRAILHPRQDDSPARKRAGDPAGAVGHRHRTSPGAARDFPRTTVHWPLRLRPTRSPRRWTGRSRNSSGSVRWPAPMPVSGGCPQGEAYYAGHCVRALPRISIRRRCTRWAWSSWPRCSRAWSRLLRAQGLTQGTAGERMTALGKDPRYLFPNTDAGRDQILAYVNGRLADIRTRLPRAFATLAPGNLLVKRVPPAIENGAPDGYAGPGTIDGSQPGLYYINLRDTAIWPRYALPTLSYHEGIPGHVWQGEYTYKLPLIRSLLEFNAYSEGWALYAEQLADELGVYDDDPLGKLGYLQSLAFRACRLVVDTGMHAKRWSRGPRDRVVRNHQRLDRHGSDGRGGSLLRMAGTGLRLQGRSHARSRACETRPRSSSAHASTCGCSTMPSSRAAMSR